MGTFEANGNWDDIGKALRLHILCWKYYYFDEIKETLVKQVNRIESSGSCTIYMRVVYI